MCTGRPPFRAAEAMAILMRVCEDTLRPIREIIPETPVWLCDLISRLHAKDRARRYQSAREVADLLQRYQADLESNGGIVPVSLRQAGPRWSLGMQLAAAVVVVLIGVLAWWLPRHLGEGGGESPRKERWQPGAPFGADELAEMLSPFDDLDRKELPKEATARMCGGADRVPPELVAVLEGSPLQLHRPRRTSWLAQDREGKWLAVPCETEVLLFDCRTMTPVKTLGPVAERIYRIAFSPDSKRLAAAYWTEEYSAVVWEVETGKQSLRLNHKGNCRSIQFSPDGSRLLTVGADGRPILWDARSGEELNRFPPHDQQRAWPEATFTTDGKGIVTWTSDGVKVWDAKTWAEVKTLSGPEDPVDDVPGDWHRPLAVSADGKWLAAGSEVGFKVWATTTWQEQFAAKTPATWLAFSPDGRTLLTAPHDNAEGQLHVVTRWDTQTHQRLGSATLRSRGPWAVYYLSVDGKTLYGMTCDPAEPAVHLYDADTLEDRSLPGHVGQVCAVDVSPDGTLIASAGSDGTVRVWDVATRRLLHTVPRSGKTAVQVVFSPDGKALYAAWSEDGVVRAIDPTTGRWRELAVHGPRLQRLAVSPDGAFLAAAGEVGVQLWALPGGEPRGEIPGVPLSPGPVAFSPDAKTLAVGGAESLRLFDVATKASVNILAFPGVVRWVGFRPGRRSLAAAGESTSNPVLIFDLSTGGRTLRLEGHESPILGGAWRADGGLLATVGATDGTVRLWDFGHPMPRQRVVPVFERDVHSIEAIAFSPEGRHLVTANPDGTIAIFRLAGRGSVFRIP
jgi:WD40 repeat protein